MRKKFTWLVVLLCLGIFNFFYYQYQNRTPKQKYCNSETAQMAAEEIVKQHLIAPSTAIFLPKLQMTSPHKLSECSFKSAGQLDAQNEYGAMLRLNYSMFISLNLKTNSWNATNITIEPR